MTRYIMALALVLAIGCEEVEESSCDITDVAPADFDEEQFRHYYTCMQINMGICIHNWSDKNELENCNRETHKMTIRCFQVCLDEELAASCEHEIDELVEKQYDGAFAWSLLPTCAEMLGLEVTP